jgi:hypothetical protein
VVREVVDDQDGGFNMSDVTGGRELKIEVDLVNEQVVIGAAVAGWDDGTCEKLLRMFGPDHFLAIEHGVIWQTFREMKARKLGFDLATAKQISGGQFDNNLVDLVSQIADARPDVPENLEYHIASLNWDRSKRTCLQGPYTALGEELQDSKGDPERAHSIARQLPNSLRSGERKHLYDTATLVRLKMSQIEAMSGGVRYPFGLDGLDYFESVDAARSAGIIEPEKLADAKGRVRRMIPAAEPGYITLVSGMTGGGKSEIAAAITLALALRKRKVLYCAWEPKAEMTLQSLACTRLGWSRRRVLQGMITTEEKAILKAKMEAIGQYVKFMGKGAFYDFSSGKKKRTNQENLDIFASYVSDSGCDVVIADLWKYALVSQMPNDEEEALKYQQAMCDDMRFHLFLLQQQVHKQMEMRTDKRPSREGVKGSGAYLEIVDNFIAPHIPSKWKPGIAADKFEVFVLKQRYGEWPLGIEFEWNAASGSISGGRSIPYDFDMSSKSTRGHNEVKERGWKGPRRT